MKRERLEDLGRIYQLMHEIIDDENAPFYLCTSKHSIDSFVDKYKIEENLYDLNDWLRWHKDKLEEIYCLANGYEE